MKIKNLLPEILLLLLTFLLPLKFGTTIGVPEMPMTYWTKPFELLIVSWPVQLFPFFAAFVLAVNLLLVRIEKPIAGLRVYGICWILLLLTALTGGLNASTWDFTVHNVSYLIGMTCWVLALVRALENNPDFRKYLWGVLIASLIFSVYSALNQYLTGFDDTIKYIQEKEVKTGVKLLDGQFGNRMREGRITGDFSVCNVYAGYLVLVFPILLAALWELGDRVTPALPAKLLLTIPTVALFLFLLKGTGSRGAVLAMIGGIFIGLLCCPLSRKWKVFLWSILPIGTVCLLPFIQFGRRFNSFLIRLDYFQAAAKMIWIHPLTGCGWGEFMNDYLILKNVVNDESPHSPHNILLTLGAQCGIPAFLLITIIILSGLGAALYVLYCQSKDKKNSIAVPFALVWGLSAWIIHAMVDLDYETPASLGLATAVSVMALQNGQFNSWIPQKTAIFLSDRKCRILFCILCTVVCIAGLWYPWRIVSAEYHYDKLFNKINIRYAADPLGAPPSPEEVRQLLSKCDPRSPFPYSEASDYFLRKGPYYLTDALAMLDQAILLSPKRSAYYFRRYRMTGLLPEKKAESEEALRKARELSPKNPRYYPDGVTPFGTRSY